MVDHFSRVVLLRGPVAVTPLLAQGIVSLLNRRDVLFTRHYCNMNCLLLLSVRAAARLLPLRQHYLIGKYC